MASFVGRPPGGWPAATLRTTLLLTVALITAAASPSELMSADEQAALQWTLGDSDCQYLVRRHERDESGRSGQPSEQLTLRAGAGTFIHANREIEPGRLIDDLKLSVWVRANRVGIQLCGRIVFPDTIDPDTGRPAELLVYGNAYGAAGQWQQLVLDAIPQKVQRQVRVLRARIKQPVPTKYAYLGGATLNVFGGPGTTQVSIGQVETSGRLPPPSPESNIGQVSYQTGMAAEVAAPDRIAGRVMVDGRPFFPRLIEHRGESFEMLRELGFNTIFLPQPPTDEQMRLAETFDLWLVCPPPRQFDRPFSRILAWYLGDDLDGRSNRVQWLTEFRRTDPHQRPMVGEAVRNQWHASRQLDVMLRRRHVLGSSFELSDLSRWLEEQSRLVRPGTPFWSNVETEITPELIRQAELISGQRSASSHLQLEQIRQVALSGVTAGARGLWFQSQSPLDGETDADWLRRRMLELVNHELRLIQPWCMGGQRLGHVASSNPELRFTAIATKRSRLMVPVYAVQHLQFACAHASGDCAITVAGVPDSISAFILDHQGLTPIERRRITGGVQIELSEEQAGSIVLLTEDPLVVTHVNHEASARRSRVVELQQEIAKRTLDAYESRFAEQLAQTPRRALLWETARQAASKSKQLVETNDLRPAFQFSQMALRGIDQLQASIWRDTTTHWDYPLTRPAGAAASLVALEADRLPQERWSKNALVGGDCEQLEHMVGSGWRQFQTAPDDIETQLALSPDRPHAGRHCLRMKTVPLSADAGQSVVEFAPIWVNSAPVTIRAGQRYRITGWLRIDEPIDQGLDGCTISDNLAGPQLALRRRTPTDGWERFEMVRFADVDDHLTVTISLHGLGEIWIDDLQISLAETR